MKTLLQILVSVFLHPVAVVLALIHVAGRSDLNTVRKLLWALVIIFFWGVGPALYVVFGKGALW
ncbi:MAG: PLDc N-terminal domain-containing protein [Candidatus Dormibacteria bacterium]